MFDIIRQTGSCQSPSDQRVSLRQAAYGVLHLLRYSTQRHRSEWDRERLYAEALKMAQCPKAEPARRRQHKLSAITLSASEKSETNGR